MKLPIDSNDAVFLAYYDVNGVNTYRAACLDGVHNFQRWAISSFGVSRLPTRIDYFVECGYVEITAARKEGGDVVISFVFTNQYKEYVDEKQA